MTARVTACIGAVLMAAGSWWVGSVPVTFRAHRPGIIGWFPIGAALPRFTFYLGLAAMTVAWLSLGRRLLHEPGTVRELRRYVACAGTPLLFALPLGRDLWAYAAQGNVLGHGLDPYAHAPSAVPGVFTADVSVRWRDSTSPYGPLWLQLCRIAVGVSGEHPLVTTLLLRLPVFAGLLLTIWTLPMIAARVGGRADLALWLGAASPLTLVLGLGGGHNDLLMVGLMVAGLAIACRGGIRALIVAGLLLGLAVAVKSPAAVAIAFAMPLSFRRVRPSLRRVVDSSLAVTAGAVAAVGVISVVAGLGLGWAKQASADASVVSWLSVPTAVAMLVKIATGTVHGATTLDAEMRHIRTAGEILAGLLVIGLWLRALRDRPMGYLVVALGAVSVLVPSVQPWYFCWPLALAGLVVARRPILITLAAASVAFPVMIRPNGVGWEMKPIAVPILLLAALLSWLALRRASAPDDDRAEHAGTQVRPDHST